MQILEQFEDEACGTERVSALSRKHWHYYTSEQEQQRVLETLLVSQLSAACILTKQKFVVAITSWLWLSPSTPFYYILYVPFQYYPFTTMPTSSKVSFPSGFSDQKFMHFSFSCVPHGLPTSFPFECPNTSCCAAPRYALSCSPLSIPPSEVQIPSSAACSQISSAYVLSVTRKIKFHNVQNNRRSVYRHIICVDY
jgi:hypothetical protein